MTSFLFVSDLDNTLVGDDAAMSELNQLLEKHRQQYRTKIVYSTGRSPTLYRQLTTEKSLLPPDVLICAVGTEIYYQDSHTPDSRWTETLSQTWDRDLVVATAARFTDLKPQPDTEQRPFKVSYHLTEQAADEIIPQMDALLRDRGLDVQFIYSSGINFDIVPRQGNKGMAMTHVRQNFGFDPDQTVACGDSGNDLALFLNREEYGIIVSNARSELLHWHHANPSSNRYLATAPCAAGILEGLRYFGFL
jgi:sucrose-6F-phosphate phosphohydrolase